MEYTKDQLTEWFDIEKQKPWEIGVYEIMYQTNLLAAAYFDGEIFKNGYTDAFPQCRRIDLAYSNRVKFEHDYLRVTRWRGLNFNPNAPTNPAKKANKRKQCIVVMRTDGWIDPIPLACFDNEKHADAFIAWHAPRSKSEILYKTWTKRFRTPEA